MDEDIGPTRIAGVSFYQSALEKCAPGQRVRFVHEPDNPHDPTALRVETLDGEQLGYLPRSSRFHRNVHEYGRGLSATIASIGYSRNCILGATLSVAMSDDEPLVRSYYSDANPVEVPLGGFRYWIKSPADVARLVAARK